METQLVIRSKPLHFQRGSPITTPPFALMEQEGKNRLGRLTENVQGAEDALRYASSKQIKVVWSCRRLGVYP